MKSQQIFRHLKQIVFRSILFLMIGTEFAAAEELTRSPMPNSPSITTWLIISFALAIFGFMSKSKSEKTITTNETNFESNKN